MNPRCLFVYGTLRPGGRAFGRIQRWVLAHEPAALPDYVLVGEGHRYPWCVEQPEGEVLGDILEIPAIELLLPRLDIYEGVDGPHPEYRRILAEVTVSSGSRTAWVYVGDVGVPQDARPVEGNSWPS